MTDAPTDTAAMKLQDIAGVDMPRLLRNLAETSYNEGSEALACRLTDCRAVITELLADRAAMAERLADAEAKTMAYRGLANNHAETLRSIRKMDPATEGERMVQWARDGLSGYAETNETTMAKLMDRVRELEAATPAQHKGGESLANDREFQRLAENWAFQSRLVYAPESWGALCSRAAAWADARRPAALPSELLTLPAEELLCGCEAISDDTWGEAADQMKDYALAALKGQAK